MSLISPLERLLGWAAFTGYVVIFLSWPLNKVLATRAGHINKSLSALRDKRMGVLNELISAVRTLTSHSERRNNLSFHSQIKFVKFFAWEERWIQRVMEARKVEMQWMVKCMPVSYLCARG